MKPTQCPSCGGGRLNYGSLADRVGLYFKFSNWRWVPVQASVCLDCGIAVPYIDDAALTKLRAWNGYGAKEKAVDDEL